MPLDNRDESLLFGGIFGILSLGALAVVFYLCFRYRNGRWYKFLRQCLDHVIETHDPSPQSLSNNWDLRPRIDSTSHHSTSDPVVEQEDAPPPYPYEPPPPYSDRSEYKTIGSGENTIPPTTSDTIHPLTSDTVSQSSSSNDQASQLDHSEQRGQSVVQSSTQQPPLPTYASLEGALFW